MARLTVTGAHKTFPGAEAPVLDDVGLSVRDGEAYVILGPSGSGKSTLLRSIAGLEELDAGEVLLDDVPAAQSAERMSMVFQDAALYPWLTVWENLGLAGRFARNRGRIGPEVLEELLQTLGLERLRNAYPETLSGGQAQRVAVGRALALNPDVLLMDEPLSALDPATREDLQQWLRRLIEKLGLTAVVVTHDIDEATVLGDRVGFFDGPQGLSAEWEVDRGASDPDAASLSGDIRDYYRRSRGDYAI